MTITQSDRGCDLWCKTCGEKYDTQVNADWMAPWMSAVLPSQYIVYHYKHIGTLQGACVGWVRWFSEQEPNIHSPGTLLGDQGVFIETMATKTDPNARPLVYGITAPAPLSYGTPQPTPVPAVVASAALADQLKKAVNKILRPSKCECGASAIGVGQYMAGHSSWCPVASRGYNDQAT